MKLDISEIEFSNKDRKRNILIPNKITKELAELIGIIMGDGSTGIYKGNGYTHYEIRLYGHKKEDLNYYNKIVDKLFKKFIVVTFII